LRKSRTEFKYQRKQQNSKTEKKRLALVELAVKMTVFLMLMLADSLVITQSH